eukprot:SAG31_NODE_14566_length_799_cov_0.715714_1_plen_22_part_10
MPLTVGRARRLGEAAAAAARYR